MGLNCLSKGGPTYCNLQEREVMTAAREHILTLVLKMKKENPSWGFWLRSCFEHSVQSTWLCMDIRWMFLMRKEVSNLKDVIYN